MAGDRAGLLVDRAGGELVTLHERAESYANAFPKYPASHLRVVREKKQDVLYGTWLIGQDYRNKTTYYGAYPPSYLERIQSLFPDIWLHGSTWRTAHILHAFSGSLPDGYYMRCDSNQDAEINCRVEDIAAHPLTRNLFELVMADPPYSEDDATKYGTPMVNRGKCLRALAEVTRPNGHLVWLDTVWPMFSKTQWRTVGRIALVRSTNHRVRLISIFERVIA